MKSEGIFRGDSNYRRCWRRPTVFAEVTVAIMVASLVASCQQSSQRSQKSESQSDAALVAAASTPSATSEDGLVNKRNGDSECAPLDPLATRNQTREGSHTLRDGRVVKLVQNIDSSEQDKTSMFTSLTIEGDLLLKTSLQRDGTTMDLRADYGPEFSGIRSAQVSVRGTVVKGSIDGRAIVQMKTSDRAENTAFADGEAPPRVSVDDEVSDAIALLLGGTNCETNVNYGAGKTKNPKESAECIACWAACIAGGAICLVAAAAGCGAALFFYLVCFALAATACVVVEIACFVACNVEGGLCCPVGCGDSCCARGESCLDGTIGTCCEEGLSACVGTSCCEPTEACIASGAEAGNCCPAKNLCGNTCCGDLETCVDDTFCCPLGADPCGDGCCGIGEQCNDANECCAEGKACGEECCGPSEMCNASGQCESVCDRGDFLCNNGTCCGPSQVCTDVPGICCGEGEYYCDGQCKPVGECIL